MPSIIIIDFGQHNLGVCLGHNACVDNQKCSKNPNQCDRHAEWLELAKHDVIPPYQHKKVHRTYFKYLTRNSCTFSVAYGLVPVRRPQGAKLRKLMSGYLAMTVLI